MSPKSEDLTLPERRGIADYGPVRLHTVHACGTRSLAKIEIQRSTSCAQI